MNRYAVLCGAAPEGFLQKKINDMHDFLVSDAGGAWLEKEIMIFPNGVNETMLEYVASKLCSAAYDETFIYICTEFPVAEMEKSFWLCGDEIRKSILKGFSQIVYDFSPDFICVEDSCCELESVSQGWN